MDILMAEIERKKRELESSGVVGPNKKYFRRGELEEREKEKRKQVADQNKKEPTVVKTGPDEEDEQKDAKEVPKVAPLPRKDVIRKLRERDEPIILFGETEFEAYLRLKRLETQEPDVKREGYSNDFKAAMDQVDQQYLEEIIKSSEGGGSNDVSIKDDGTTLKDIATMRQELGQGDKDRDQEIILRFFKYILKMWGNELNKRAVEEKRSTKGKMESATHTQTVSYLKPFFRKLKRKAIDHDLLESIVEIVKRIMDKDYIKANDAYLEMAIGNAPWPIGVTMVGIHARTGREKISSKYVAHVLNDETQRKYIQAMKRLMTQCQNLFPTDPSRSFNYQSPV